MMAGFSVTLALLGATGLSAAIALFLLGILVGPTIFVWYAILALMAGLLLCSLSLTGWYIYVHVKLHS